MVLPIKSNTGAVRRFVRVAGCSLLALSMALPPGLATAQLPGLGDGSEMSAGAERRLGDQIARELYRDPDYFDDPVLVEYLQGIWDALLEGSRERGEMSPELDERFAWQLLMGRDREVNAFALPGGYMGVYAGLIAITASRDELASVLAHELSHITQRHISRLMSQQGRTTPLLIAAMVLGALAASKNPQAAGALMTGGTALAAQMQLNFSRDMEREADRVGYGVMTQAGFDGRGFSAMFEKLQMASNLNDNGSYPYLRSHPLTTERIADMRNRVPLDTPPPVPIPVPVTVADPAPSAPAAVGTVPTLREVSVSAAPRNSSLEHALVATRARVVSRSAVDTLRAWAAEPDQSGFTAQPRLRQAPALYASAMANMQQRNFDAARRHAARLATQVAEDAPSVRLARLLAAEIELAAGDGARVVAVLTPAGAAAPPATLRRPELVLLAQATQHGGRVADLTSRLQTWVGSHPRDATAWQLLATSYRADIPPQPLRAVRAEAEAQVAHLDWAGAIDRYRAGQELMRRGGQGADYIEASIIDTRLREAESRLREDAVKR